ncbi:pseudo histidine-containing phosphotransfer protein 2-like, partial [Macadamia integrifolia]|uniref:pseudo histidine-containing phosphotransfer protein 2-like n=1 Tax=Macadamia integrifolia TaxID=60698 RepID=UPI001C4E4801
MEKNHLAIQAALMRQSLFSQGYLDGHFIQLEELQDETEPNFVEDTINLFFRESPQFIVFIERGLDKSPIDFNTLDGYIHKIKGSSSSIGAKKVSDLALEFRYYCDARDAERCKKALEKLKIEHAILKEKLK